MGVLPELMCYITYTAMPLLLIRLIGDNISTCAYSMYLNGGSMRSQWI